MATARRTTAWRPQELGVLVAERRLLLRRRGRRATPITIVLGRPVQEPNPEPGAPWWCPVEVTGLGKKQFSAVGGVDSLQALVLALKWTHRALRGQAHSLGGAVDWLGESERPVFGDTDLLGLLEAAAANLRGGLLEAIALLQQPVPAARARGAIKRFTLLCERRGFNDRARRR